MATHGTGPGGPPIPINPPPAPAPAPAPPANPPLTFTQLVHRIKKILAHIFLFLSSTATLTATYFSARALSPPWTPSQTPILVALVSLLIIDLFALMYLSTLVFFIVVTAFASSGRAARYIDACFRKVSNAALFGALYVLYVALTVAMIMATCFAAWELRGRPRVEPGLVIALMLLGPLDVLLVGCMLVFVGCELVDLFDFKGRAKVRWRNLGALRMPERTREEALELVRREFEMGV